LVEVSSVVLVLYDVKIILGLYAEENQ